MLNMDTISRIAAEVAAARLGDEFTGDARAEPRTDSVGQDALRITLVIRPGAARRLRGDAVVKTLVEIQNAFWNAGEERRAIIEYATEEELEQVGDSGS